MYARNFDSQTLTFDFAEGLVNNNLLFVDRETNSLWSQLESKAISGSMKNTPLEMVPSLQTTWKFWREKHPDTQVLVEPGKEGRHYFYRNWQPGTPRPKLRPQKHDISNLGLGLVSGKQAMYFPFHELEQIQTPTTVVDPTGKIIRIHFNAEAMTAWAEDPEGRLLSGVLSYQNGWLDFFPDSKVFDATSLSK